MSCTFYSVESAEGEIFVGHHLLEFLDVKTDAKALKKIGKYFDVNQKDGWYIEQITSTNNKTYSQGMKLLKDYYITTLDAVNVADIDNRRMFRKAVGTKS